MDEIMKALKRMKVGKAAGYDKISSEMLRDSEGIVASPLCQLFNKCWKSRRADDHVIVTMSACELQMVCKMKDSVKKRSMKINIRKTRVLVFERGESTTKCDI
ncbi:hypothetical protein EVAR_48090_1 [Eumeta japonica]|uniref:Reverse transcriptase domain-containing protein n=1 Tax=Eumeta variegata TaxID=151549 RepID=A0A4C1XLF3_EUMVA|nr:hypothetical protein EVAR_48090_1 [Eumeta japonica]